MMQDVHIQEVPVQKENRGLWLIQAKYGALHENPRSAGCISPSLDLTHSWGSQHLMARRSEVLKTLNGPN